MFRNSPGECEGQFQEGVGWTGTGGLGEKDRLLEVICPFSMSERIFVKTDWILIWLILDHLKNRISGRVCALLLITK